MSTVDLIATGVLGACLGFVGGVFFAAWLNTTGGDE